MSAEENKAIVRRLYDEIHSRGNMAAADELVSSDFVDHDAPAPGLPTGPELIKQVFTMYRAAFPDLQATVEDMIAEGDKVVARLTVRGTHKGEFMGMAATGKEVTVAAIDIMRITGGKLVERWGISDDLGMMQQLGVVPPPEQAGGSSP